MEIVAYQGEAGAYSEAAAVALFPEADQRALPSIRTVFESVEVGRARWGLAPMDNSQAGSINETYDLFLRHGLHLVGETIVRVDHCLLALPGTRIDDIQEVISHPQAIAQSEEFLSALEVTVRAEYNTAGAAKTHRRAAARADSRDRIPPRRRALRARSSCGEHSDVPRQLHAFRRSLARPLAAWTAEQVVARLRRRPRRGFAVSLPRRARRAPCQPDEARVPPPPRPSMGVRLLCRRRGGGRSA